MRIATTSRAGALFGLLALAAAAAWWGSAPPPPLAAGQILTFLPPGTTLHSFVRFDIDGRLPSGVAAVARVPSFPGAPTTIAVAVVLRYDRWHRRYAVVYQAPNPGRVPFSVDAARLLGNRDAAIFSGLNDDDSRSYAVVGIAAGRPAVLRAGRVEALFPAAEPLLVEGSGASPRAYQWNGRGWDTASAPEHPAAQPTGLIWVYAVRDGKVVARTSVVHVRPRQPLRVQAAGSSAAASIVVPDPRFDQVEAGYRQRTPGTYTIRIVTGFTPLEAAYTLTVVVAP